MKLLFTLLILPALVLGQKPPKKTNTIEVQGVTFRQMAASLMDAGYYIEKADSNFQTIRTEFKTGTGKNKNMKMRLMVRIKDSTAIITGDWYNTMFVGSKILGVENSVENSTFRIENASVNPKNCFNEMNAFALSLNKPVTYSTKP